MREAYDLLKQGDVDGLVRLFVEDGKIFIPGQTSISGDHEREQIPDVLRQILAANVRREILEVAGAYVTVHEYVTKDGVEHGYHAVHVWDLRDGKVAYWWWYLHEYDEFMQAWT